MWKIKDPELKAKVNAFFSDEEVSNAFVKNTDCYKYFRLSTNINKSSFTFLIDKDLMKFIPDYDPDDWNPFPKVTPRSDIVYFVTLKAPSGQTVVTTSLYLAGFGWRKNFNLEVIAFREFPKPYKEHDK